MVKRQGDEIHLDEDEASAGVKGQGVRWVLGIGLLLVIIAMSLIWIIPALTD